MNASMVGWFLTIFSIFSKFCSNFSTADRLQIAQNRIPSFVNLRFHLHWVRAFARALSRVVLVVCLVCPSPDYLPFPSWKVLFGKSLQTRVLVRPRRWRRAKKPTFGGRWWKKVWRSLLLELVTQCLLNLLPVTLLESRITECFNGRDSQFERVHFGFEHLWDWIVF